MIAWARAATGSTDALAVGAPQFGTPRREGAGIVFGIFGRRRAESFALAELGDRGVRIDGEHEFANFGESLAPLGDVNGDGRRDILIGAPGASRSCSPDEGAAYVIFTPATPTPLDLSDLGANGYAISGGVPEAHAGLMVAGAGDWNRDGRGDALVLRGDFDGSQDAAPRLDLLLGRGPPPIPPAPAQPPQLEVPEPSVRDLLSRRGLEARVAPACRCGSWRRDARSPATSTRSRARSSCAEDAALLSSRR